MTRRDPASETREPAFETLILGAPAGVAADVARRSGAWVDEARRLFRHPDIAAMGRRNRLSTAVFYVFAVAGGSGASVIAALLGAWALISLVARRFRFRLAASDYPVVLTTLLFFAVIVASDVVHGDPDRIPASLVALLPFVIPFFLVQRMRLSRFRDTLPPAFFGAAVGGVLLIPIVITEYGLMAMRVQGFSGNSGPLSVSGLLCVGWSILFFRRGLGRWGMLLAFAGVAGGCLAVVLSGMRGAWPLLPACIAIAAFVQRREFAAVWGAATIPARLAIMAGAALAATALVAVALPAVFVRIELLWSDVGLIAAHSEAPTSLNLRRGMYEAALQAIWARPWFGYGGDQHWEAVTPFLNPTTFEGMSFSHFHNVVLTVGVDAGLIGIAALLAMVAAPLWTAWAARHTLGGSRRLGAALVLVVAFFGAGMTNIMIFHDILDAIWVFSISLIAASVPAPAGPDTPRTREA